MGDYRYKGYVNDFMFSPRNPVTSNVVQSSEAAIKEKAVEQSHILSADIREKKNEADAEIALFKSEKQKAINNAELSVLQKAGEGQGRVNGLRGAMVGEETEGSNVQMAAGYGMAERYRNKLETGPFQFYDPWGKGHGNPKRKPDGSYEGFAAKSDDPKKSTKEPYTSWTVNNSVKEAEDNVGTGLNTESRYGGGGSVVKAEDGTNRTRYPITLRRDGFGNSTMTELDGYNPFKGRAPESTQYFPFGKPGAGAPIRDDQGKLVSQRHNIDFAHELDSSADIHKKKRAAEEYLKELKKEMQEQRRNRAEASLESRAPIGELAALIQQGKVGNPKRNPQTGELLEHHHVYSDITKAKFDIRDTKKFAGVVGEDDSVTRMINTKNYYEDLSKLAEERYKVRQQERDRNLQDDFQHTQTWNDLWGKPGAGAPNSIDPDATFKRKRLDKVLFNVENKDTSSVLKNTPAGIKSLHPTHYSKSTISSNHTNMFEMPQEPSKYKQQAKGDYKMKAPFAVSASF